MNYAQLNEDGTFYRKVQEVNTLWDETHFCKPGALTPDERTLFRVVEVYDGTPPTVNPVIEYVITNNPSPVNGVWTVQYAVGQRSVADARAILKDRADAEFAKRLEAGIVFGGLPIKTSDRNVINVIGANRNPKATRNLVVSRTPVTLTEQSIGALEVAIADYTDALNAHMHTLYTAINAATTLQDLSAINPAAGWPSNVS